MNGGILPIADGGLILCPDKRLCRLLETELSYLGVSAQSPDDLPKSPRELRILLLDGDSFQVSDGIQLATACACPLLVFSHEPDRTVPAEGIPNGTCLRRPFSLTDLGKTLRALLFETPYPGAQPPPAKPEPPAEATSALTVQDGMIRIEGLTVPLTPAELTILEYLYAHRDKTVTREELSALLGGGGNSVEVYICRLRTKIEKPLGRRMIRTVRGVGYSLESVTLTAIV